MKEQHINGAILRTCALKKKVKPETDLAILYAIRNA